MNITELNLFSTNVFNDTRLVRRGNLVILALVLSGSAVCNKAFSSLSERTGAYRFFKNSKVKIESILAATSNYFLESIKRMDTKEHLLIIQDTTELGFINHAVRLGKNPGNTGEVNTNFPGFFCHVSIALGATTNHLYGIPHAESYSWAKDRERQPGPGKVPKKPVRERCSYRWINTINKVKEILPDDQTATIIADREADIYELMAMKLPSNMDLLVRSNYDRKLNDSDYKLKEHMASCKTASLYEFKLPSRGHGHKARQVRMEIKYDKVVIRQAYIQGAKERDIPREMTMYCVSARETSTPPAGEAPVEWRLLTTREITTEKEARESVEFYRKRWFIEEVFRVLKKQGLNIEEVQLESLESIKKLTMLALVAAIKIVSLKTAFDTGDEEVDALRHFTPHELKILKERILPKLEGKTKKQQNLHAEGSLPWVAWTIARLGGWSGYTSQSKPGYCTFKWGIDKFNLIVEFC